MDKWAKSRRIGDNRVKTPKPRVIPDKVTADWLIKDEGIEPLEHNPFRRVSDQDAAVMVHKIDAALSSEEGGTFVFTGRSCSASVLDAEWSRGGLPLTVATLVANALSQRSHNYSGIENATELIWSGLSTMINTMDETQELLVQAGVWDNPRVQALLAKRYAFMRAVNELVYNIMAANVRYTMGGFDRTDDLEAYGSFINELLSRQERYTNSSGIFGNREVSDDAILQTFEDEIAGIRVLPGESELEDSLPASRFVLFDDGDDDDGDEI